MSLHQPLSAPSRSICLSKPSQSISFATHRGGASDSPNDRASSHNDSYLPSVPGGKWLSVSLAVVYGLSLQLEWRQQSGGFSVGSYPANRLTKRRQGGRGQGPKSGEKK